MSPNGGLKAAPPPPQKQNSEHTGGELNGLVVYGDVRIGLTLYSSSCGTRYELNIEAVLSALPRGLRGADRPGLVRFVLRDPGTVIIS